MAHTINHDLVLGRAIENQVGVGIGHHAAQVAFAGEVTGMGVLQQEIDDGLNAGVHTAGTLRRMLRDIGQIGSSTFEMESALS